MHAAPASVPYAALAHAFAKVEATTKRCVVAQRALFRALALPLTNCNPLVGLRCLSLEIQRIVCDLLRSTIALTPEDLLRLVYLASNKLAPQFENLELGIGDALLMKAIVEATGAWQLMNSCRPHTHTRTHTCIPAHAHIHTPHSSCTLPSLPTRRPHAALRQGPVHGARGLGHRGCPVASNAAHAVPAAAAYRPRVRRHQTSASLYRRLRLTTWILH